MVKQKQTETYFFLFFSENACDLWRERVQQNTIWLNVGISNISSIRVFRVDVFDSRVNES